MTLARKLLAPGLVALGLLGVATPVQADWTASGRFNYTDRLYDLSGFTGTAVAPVREADVEVYDLNTLAVLGSGASDGNGDFSIAIVDSSTRDVGVRVLSSTDETPTLQFSVVDDGSGNAVYLYHDAATDELGHGSSDDLAFGTMTMPAAIGNVATTDWSSQVFNAFDMLLLVADWIDSVDGARPSVFLTIRWNPTNGRGGSSYSSGSNRIFLSDDDAYDDPNILHEIGHYVEDEFGSSQNTGGAHFLSDDDQDPRLAWSEGVATAFSGASLELAGRPRPDIYCDRDSFGVSGGGGFAYQFESGVSGGSTSEKAVNAALWDLVDQAASLDASPGSDDDPLAGAGASVWAVVENMRLVDPPATSLEDFWDLWFALGLGNQIEMAAIFAGHQIDFAEDGQEPNDTPALATLLSVGASYLENSFFRSGAVAGGDEDWFRFAATAGNYYRIEVSGSANTIYGRPDPELFLLDPDLEPLAFSDDPHDTSLNNQSSGSAQDMDETAPSILFQAATSGDHYLYLRHASFPLNLEGRYGTYRVRVQSPSAPTASVDAVAAQRMLQGESYQALVIGDDFATGASVTLSDPGLVVSQVRWIAPSALVVMVDVDAGVPDGSYSLTVTNPGGSPGVLGSAVEVSGSASPAIVISEVQLGSEKVEIRNLGTSSADLTDWQISSYRPGSSTGTFTFPAFALAAGATVVVSDSSGTDTATELFDPGGVFNWPWFNGRGGGVSLIDDGGRNVDYLRFVDSFVDEHEDPLGSGGLWMQPELLSAATGFTLSRAEPTSLYRSRFGLSASNPTMPNGAGGRDNAVDAWEDNDTSRRILLFSTDVTISDLAISPRPSDSDEDWFGFAVSAGDAVDFEATFTHASGDLNMELYAPGDETSPILVADSTTDDESVALNAALTTLHGGGVYRIRVFGLSGATNSYALTSSGAAVCGNSVLESGETCDDGNTDSGDCCSPSCQLEPNGTVCRVAADVCDTVESCDGISDACPSDAFEPITTECLGSAGACDAADFCDGLNAACPADLKLTSECRGIADLCDVAESCDGISDDCPSDGFEPVTTECRGSAGACDAADFCDGSNAACPVDLKLTSECRGVADGCDVAESCDGILDDCPSDAFEPVTTECRGAAGACDAADFCDGSSAVCPADLKLTSECRASADLCDVAESCDGILDDCPNDALEPITTECRGAAGACDAPDFCDGSNAACPADLKLTSECRGVADVCDVAESCDGILDDCPSDAFEPITTLCRLAISICDVAEFCSGASAACPSDQTLSGMSCPDGDVCNGEEVCNEFAVCVPGEALDCDDGNVCTADSCSVTGGCLHEPISPCTAIPALTPSVQLLFALAWALLGGLALGRRERRNQRSSGPGFRARVFR